MDLGDRTRLGSWTCPGSPGSPPGAPPGRGRKSGSRKFPEISPGRAGPGRAGPGTPRGPGRGAPEMCPKWTLFGPYYTLFSAFEPPFWGGPQGVPFLGSPGCPRGRKKCTFFWVFNNSPSRDSLGHFFPTPFLGGYPGDRGDTPIWAVLMGSNGAMEPPPCAASCAWDWIVREAV